MEEGRRAGALPSPAVLTMYPPGPFLSAVRMSFRRFRSSSLSILRETPMWSIVGM